MLALSATSTPVPVSHAATATSFTFAVGGDHGDSLTTGDGAASLTRLAGSGSDFYLAIGDLSYINTTTGDTWCSQFKSSYNNVEVLAGNHDTGEENGTAATRSYERYVTGCPYTLTSVPNCGPVLLNCYGKEYYFDYPAVNPIARFIMISPVVFNITGVCSVATKCNSAFGSPCDDLHGCWGYNKFDPHYNWVSNTIDNARTSSTIKWVVVGMHKVCISAGDQSCNIGPDLLNLMISKKVDLVLEGHDHSYQRSKQLALNTSTCTGITTTSSFPIYNSNCVVNDGSAGVYTPGAGTVVVIQGTFGAAYNTVNDPSINGGASAAEAPYFAKLMGTNTPGNGHGFMQYTMTPDRIDAKSSFSGSFQDSFTIGKAFALSSSPSSLVFQAGSSGSSTVTIASQGGFTGTVSLSLSQTGCACTISSINPTSVDLTTTSPNASTILQVSGTFAGNVTLMVTGTSGAVSFSTQVAVSVQDFSISTTKPSLTLNFDASDTSPINLASLNNFAGTVTLAPTSSPSGLTFSLSPLSIPIPSKGSGSATLSVTGSAPGNYTVTVGATSGPTSHALVVKVRVLGDFTLSSTKTAMTLSPGSVDSSIIITLIGSGKYSGTVNLSAAVTPVTPSGPTASLALTSLMLKATTSSDGTNSTTLTVNAGMVSGPYSISITATSGLLSHSTVITLTVTQAHPIISTTLSSSTISAGGSASDSALLTGATTTADGTVTYRVFSGSVCSGAPIFIQTVSVTNGVVPSSRAVQFNATGSFEWQATYSGDANNALPPPTSCGSELLTVKVTTTTVTTALSSASIVPGAVVSDSATLAGFFGGFSSGGTATYSVFAGTGCTGTPAFIQTVSVNSVNGAIPNSRNVQFNTTGTFQWQVTYNGDANNGISTSLCGSESLSVGKATPSITTTLSPNSIVVGNSAADTATVTGGTTPTGTVTFSVYSDSICSGTVVATKTVPLASGSAGPVRVVLNNTGTFSWQAAYNGDANNNPNNSPCKSLVVGKASPVITTSLSSTSIQVGSSVSDSASMTGSFQAGGTVTYRFFGGSVCSGTSTPVGSPVTVAGGVVPNSISQSFNSAGPYSWNAAYSGDANNNLATSPCESLTVNKANPTITTALSQNVIIVGSSVTDSATLTNNFQAGGTVTYSFFSGSTCGGAATVVGSPVAVSNGIVPNSASKTFDIAGPYSWNAVYSGDVNNNVAISACEPLTVNQKLVSITTSLSAPTITVGSLAFDSAAITGATSTAGGTVSYNLFTSGTCSGSPSVVSTVTVTNAAVPNSRSVTFNSTAPVGWNAAYSGDSNNSGATSACEPLTVNKTSPTISTSLSINPITVGQSITQSATLTGGFQAGGSVTYLEFSTGTCSGSNTPVSTVTVTNSAIPSSSPVSPVPSGTYGFEASYSGDANNNPITSSCASLTVNKANPTITTSLSLTVVPVGSSVSDSATMTGGFQVGGTVTYVFFVGSSCNGTPTTVGSPVAVSNGAVPGSTSQAFNNAGAYSWNAAYSGDSNNNQVTSPCEPLTVNKASPTISTNLSANPVTVGGSVSDFATITGGFQPGGSATYFLFSTADCTGSKNQVSVVSVSNGVIPSSTPQTFGSAGSFSWNVGYSGDSNNNASTSLCEPLTVNKASPAISTNLSQNVIIVGNSVSDSSTMTNSFQASGTVSYNLFTSGTCSGSPSVVSTVTVTNAVVPNSRSVIFNSTAPFSWNAVYSGDASNSPATSLCEPLTVNKANPTLATTVSATSATIGTAFHDSAALTGAFNSGGTVSYNIFSNNACSGSGTLVGSPVVVAGGVVPDSASVTPSFAGPYSFQASYSGDANNNVASGACEPFAVSKASPTITTTLSANSIIVGGSASDSAVLSGGFSAGGTATYTYFQGSVCAGPGTTVGLPATITNGAVPNSSSQTFSSAGPYSWNAVYNGDTNNNAAASAREPLTVTKASPTISTSVSQNPITVGGSVFDSTTMTGSFQAGGSVSYNLFTGGTCSGSPSVVSIVTVTNAVVPNSRPVTFNSTAPVSWNAAYSGDANNNLANSPCEPLTVNPKGVAIATSLSSTTITVGGSVFDSAVLTNASGSAGGTVNYNLFNSGTCSGSSTLVSTVTVTNAIVPNSRPVTFNSTAAFSWNAVYSGDPNNSGAPSPCEPLNVNRTSPTISTSLSANPIIVGQSITESGTLTGSFQAGGSVTYLEFATGTCSGSSTPVSTVTVTNGIIPSSSQITPVPSGTYGFEASYSGDANNNPITSLCASLTVSKSSPTITTSLSLTTILVGSSVSDSATMTSGYQPGGTVTYAFFIGGSCTGTSTIVGSSVTVTNGVVPGSGSQGFNNAGSYSWNAAYNGDANNNAITSPCEPLTVSKASPVVSTTLSANPITVGGSVSDFATMTGGFQAGGSATYFLFSGGTCTGAAGVVSTVSVVNGGISSSTPRTFSSAGLYSWNAVYSGDANNNGSPSSCEPLTVNPTIVTISTALSSSSITVGGSVTDSATLTGVTSAAGGTVTYNSFQTASCTGTPAVVSTVTVTNGVVPGSASKILNSAGSFSWNALYSGDANNGGATSACEPLVVNQAIPSITTTVSSNNVPVGTLVHDSATLSNGFNAGGTVTYTLFSDAGCAVSGVILSTVTVANGVVPDSSATTLTAGAYSFQASYTGDANNKPVTGACEPFNVLKASPGITTNLSLTTIPVGSSVSDSATMTGGYQPSGTVTYVFFTGSSCTESSTTVGSPVAVTNGVIPGSTSQTFNSAGAYGWSAVYSGDANNNPITSPCEPLTVNKASPSITTTLSMNPIAVGGSVYDSTAMTGAFQGGVSATYFLVTTADCTGTKNQVSVVTVSNGVIPSSIPQPFNIAGPYSWNLGYSGDANNNASTSPCEPLTVNKASPSISTTLSANVIVVGNSVPDSATITNSFQAGGTLTYTFYTGSTCGGIPTVVGTPVTVTSGVVPTSSSHTFDAAGAYSWSATYSGDANNNLANSACEPLTVNPKGVAIATSLSSTTIAVGGSVFDSAVLTGATSGAGGTVTYNLFSSGICSGSPSSISNVTVTSSAIPNSRSVIFNSTSPVSWNAVYSGDANNRLAQSLCEPLTVNKVTPTLATTVSATSATIGSAFHDSATLTGAFSAGGTVSYSMFSNNACSGSSTQVGSPVTVTVVLPVQPSVCL